MGHRAERPPTTSTARTWPARAQDRELLRLHCKRQLSVRVAGRNGGGVRATGFKGYPTLGARTRRCWTPWERPWRAT